MPDYIEVKPASGALNSTIQPPGSKSLTNRALPIAAMASGRSVLSGVLDSDDTKVMIQSLQTIGVKISHDKSLHLVTVDGVAGIVEEQNQAAELFIGNSGTTIRFLTALLGFVGGEYTLDGIARMRERPIGPLVEALNALGATVVAESPNGLSLIHISEPTRPY